MNNLKKNYLLRSIKILDLNDHSEKTSDIHQKLPLTTDPKILTRSLQQCLV